MKKRLTNRMRFRKDDPLRDLHVPKSQRLDEDEGDFSDAIDEMGDAGDNFSREYVREYGEVIPEEELQ